MVKYVCPICNNENGNGFAKGRGRWSYAEITSSILERDVQQDETVDLGELDVNAELEKTKAWLKTFSNIPNDDFMALQDHGFDAGIPHLACNMDDCKRKLNDIIRHRLKDLRATQMAWIDSKIGLSNTIVTRPFTPIKVNKETRTLDILGRRITLGENGIPAQYTSFFSGSNTKILQEGRNAFAAPPRFECLVAGNVLELKPTPIKFTKTTSVAVEWTAENVSELVILTIKGRLEFDGCLEMQVTFSDHGKNTLFDDIRFVVPWAKDIVKYSTGLDMRGGACPDAHFWKWDRAKYQDAVWLGDVNIGAMLRFKGRNYHRPMIESDLIQHKPSHVPNSWGTGSIDISKLDGKITLTVSSGPKRIPAARNEQIRKDHFNIDWYFTPFKKLDLHKHISDRCYHAPQGVSITDESENLKKEGVNVISIDHNRSFDNYDSEAYLSDIIQKAHDAGMKVVVYYGTHELSVSKGMFTLSPMSNSILKLINKEDQPSHDTDPGYYYRLERHIGHDIATAWRDSARGMDFRSNRKIDWRELEKSQPPVSGWDNFYLEGLNFLVQKVGIDGIYIDNTKLERKSMQRARRILDRGLDDNRHRRIDMRLFSRLNGESKLADNSIIFMELYPYYDRLWRTIEGGDVNLSPEFMLMEISGIPYGLMSEIQGEQNIWHGIVFGMTCRWPLAGDPCTVWRIMDQFGIADAEFIGWWDPACPVKCDHPLIKVSVYRKSGVAMIAIASWAQKTEIVKLEINWAILGVDQNKPNLDDPNFEDPRVARVSASYSVVVEANKGWLLLAAATPLEVAPFTIENFTKYNNPSVQKGKKTPRGRPKNLLNKDLLPAIEEAIKALGRKTPELRKLLAMRCAIRTTWDNAEQEHMVSRTELMNACRKFRQNGIGELKAKKHPGKKRKLKPKEEGQLKNWVVTQCDSKGGFRDWTLEMLVTEVKNVFGVCYTPSGMRAVLGRLKANLKNTRTVHTKTGSSTGGRKAFNSP